MNRLAPEVKTIWALSAFLRALILSIAVFVYELMAKGPLLNLIDLPTGMPAGLIFLIGIIISLIYPALKYRYWKFDVRQDELYIERGVLTRVKTVAPFRRLQHLDVQQSILERIMHLGKLVVYTAGTRGADLIIPGLPIEYAEALRDQLKNIDSEDAV